MPSQITLPSGTVLTVSPADYESADRLFRAILGALKTSGINFSEVDTDDPDLGPLLNAGLSVLANKEVSDAMWACAVRSLYGHQKITKLLFEAEESRQDIYPMAWEVVKVNVAPFFSSLVSLLKTTRKTPPSSQT